MKKIQINKGEKNMNLKNILQKMKEYIINNKKSNENIEFKDNDIKEKTTHLGSISYEYLKIIKKYQIKNGNNYSIEYLYLLLYFACRTKYMISNKNFNYFKDIFKKGYFPTPYICNKYVIKDRLNKINELENIIEYICLLEEDEKIIKYVCDYYGTMNSNLLRNLYANDSIVRQKDYWDNISFDDYIFNKDPEKEFVLNIIKRR